MEKTIENPLGRRVLASDTSFLTLDREAYEGLMVQWSKVMARCCHNFRGSISVIEFLSHALELFVVTFLDLGLSVFNLSTFVALIKIGNFDKRH